MTTYRTRQVLWLLAWLLGSPAVLSAHEAGTTRVSAAFDDRSYRIDIVTDASALAEKLEAAAGRSLAAEMSPDRLTRIFQKADEEFQRRLKILFDETASRAEATYTVVPATDGSGVAAVEIHLRGSVPPQARRFTWSYDWTFTSYTLTLQHGDEEAFSTQTLEDGQTSVPFALPQPSTRVDRLRIAWRTAVRYAGYGWTAVVPNGFDVVLFVLSLYFLSRGASSVFWQVGVFALAHATALALGANGVVAIAPAVVEPLIALSVAYVAIENLVRPELDRQRLAFVFGCGLLHGLAGASTLAGLGLPRSGSLIAVVSFNVGIDIGLLAVLAGAYLLVGWGHAAQSWYRSRILQPASTLLACAAIYLMMSRLPL